MSTNPIRSLFRWCSNSAQSRRAELRVAVLILLWCGSWMVVKLAIHREILTSAVGTVAAVAVTAILGAATVWAYLRFLGGLDELRRKIELDALALAFGVGLVVGLTGSLLGDAGVASFEELLSWLFTLMFVSYSAAAVYGYLRYS